jgi:hypothetical protein
MATRPETTDASERLWIVPASPVIWAVHFLACYILAALWCGMVVGRGGSLGTVRVVIAALTLVALAAIAVIGWLGHRAHTLGAEQAPHDDDTPEDRHRFLGFAALLLSGLSGVAVIYTALAALFVKTCR